MAFATGAIVANLYYLQPLLDEVTRTYGVGTLAGSTLNMLMQVSYALGLAFFVPLGDRLPRNRLVPAVFAVSAVTLLAAVLIPSFAGLAILTCCIGLMSVGGQILIPYSADLAIPDHRGRVVGRMMTGLLGGVLLSRVIAGIVDSLLGWQAMYLLAAGAMAIFAIILHRMMPIENRHSTIPYRELVLGSVRMMKSMPELRQRAWLGAMGFGAFSVLWSTLAFKLSDAPFRYGPEVIGAFGLLGFAGVLAANAAGRLADARRTGFTTVMAAVLLALSFLIGMVGSASIALIAIAIVLLDFGTQAMHITNQTIIYSLAPHARSRINSAYMVCYFFGGAFGSLAGGLAYSQAGWTGACILGSCFGVAALIPSIYWARREGPSAP